jgi:hypothetical protein
MASVPQLYIVLLHTPVAPLQVSRVHGFPSLHVRKLPITQPPAAQ